MLDLSILNPQQREAVETTEGPVLVLAGAGTGKTRVITYRIAHLLGKGVDPKNIVAVTFTNKAANEMKERIRQLVGSDARGMIISTFHSLCARILREHIEELGYKKNFSIYSGGDQMSVAREAIREVAAAGVELEPLPTLHKISNAKSKMLGPTAFMNRASDAEEEAQGLVYKHYQSLLKARNAVDFDDLLTLTLKLFDKHKKIVKGYQKQFDYLMVDEYQDTNHAQYKIVRALTGRRGNILVVGDDDQSIYGWRGADVANILDFERDFSRTTTIRLEQNYRSTGVILKAANHLIKHNERRKEKALWTEQGLGPRIDCVEAQDDKDEADVVVGKIAALRLKNRRPYRDFAILYRTNAQSRQFEEKLRFRRIPYIVVGGMKFYDRREVKDVIAYLSVIANPEDEVSLQRVINLPPRGIGQGTVGTLRAHSIKKKMSLYAAAQEVESIDDLGPAFVQRVRAFVKMMDDYRELSAKDGLAKAARRLIDEIRYRDELDRLYRESDQAASRFENALEVISGLADYERSSDEPTLEGFLQGVALMNEDDDQEDLLESKDSVVLTTIHGSKGLEFPHVLLVGMEEEILPHRRSASEDGIDEERRLCYVGVTRAKEHLVLTYAKQRGRGGSLVERLPSRFLEEIPEGLLQWERRGDAEPASQESGKQYLAAIRDMLNKKGAEG